MRSGFGRLGLGLVLIGRRGLRRGRRVRGVRLGVCRVVVTGRPAGRVVVGLGHAGRVTPEARRGIGAVHGRQCTEGQASRTAGTSNPARPANIVMSPNTADDRAHTGDLGEQPADAIAIVIDPNTSANRKPITRPSISGGVRSWNIVWLGMTKTMFAIPEPNISPSAIGRLPVSASSATQMPQSRVADDHDLAAGEVRPDEADDEPADQVADADRRLEEPVRGLARHRRARRRSPLA